MARIQKGKFDLFWGNTVLEDITEVEIEYEQDSEDFQTLAHQTYEIDGPVKATATITLLKTDIEALAAVLPQNFVPNAGTMSTGEVVIDVEGAIDVTANCEDDPVYNDFMIVSCGDPGQVFRMVNARTRLDGIDNPTTARTVMVKFIGEPEPGQASVQFYNEGALVPAS